MAPLSWVNLKNKMLAIPVPTMDRVATAAMLRPPAGCVQITEQSVVKKYNEHGMLTINTDNAVIHGALMWRK